VFPSIMTQDLRGGKEPAQQVAALLTAAASGIQIVRCSSQKTYNARTCLTTCARESEDYGNTRVRTT